MTPQDHPNGQSDCLYDWTIESLTHPIHLKMLNHSGTKYHCNDRRGNGSAVDTDNIVSKMYVSKY